MEQAIACNRNLRSMDETQKARHTAAMDETQKARHRVVFQHVKSAVLSAERISGGFAIRYPADADTVVQLAEFITLERLCCPFLGFEIRLDAGADHVELRITGGPDVQEFLQAEIESWR